jgi:hypothetical protein
LRVVKFVTALFYKGRLEKRPSFRRFFAYKIKTQARELDRSRSAVKQMTTQLREGVEKKDLLYHYRTKLSAMKSILRPAIKAILKQSPKRNGSKNATVHAHLE